MSPGASANVYWRGAGLPAFGVSGTFVDVSDLRAHGKDERVGVTDFYQSLEFSYRLIKVLAGPRPAFSRRSENGAQTLIGRPPPCSRSSRRRPTPPRYCGSRHACGRLQSD